jgi:hypothetical protein
MSECRDWARNSSPYWFDDVIAAMNEFLAAWSENPDAAKLVHRSSPAARPERPANERPANSGHYL